MLLHPASCFLWSGGPCNFQACSQLAVRVAHHSTIRLQSLLIRVRVQSSLLTLTLISKVHKVLPITEKGIWRELELQFARDDDCSRNTQEFSGLPARPWACRMPRQLGNCQVGLPSVWCGPQNAWEGKRVMRVAKKKALASCLRCHLRRSCVFVEWQCWPPPAPSKSIYNFFSPPKSSVVVNHGSLRCPARRRRSRMQPAGAGGSVIVDRARLSSS